MESRKLLSASGLIHAAISLGIFAGIAASLLGFLGDMHWTLDLFSHFRVQYMIGAAVLLIAAAILRKRRSASIAAFGLLLNAGLVLPLYWGSPEDPSQDAASLKVVYANVLTQNTGYAELLQWIEEEQPDVIALLEFSQEWKDALDPALSAWPHRQSRPRDDNFGIAVYSRFPLAGVTWPVLTPTGSTSLFANIRWSDLEVPFMLVHPYPPIRRYSSATARAQMGELVQRAEVSQDLALLVGDLNATPWSHSSRQLQATPLRSARLGFGVLPTWPANLPIIFRIPIDTIQTGSRWQVQDLRVGPNFGSDHLPLVARLTPLAADAESVADQPSGSTR